MITGYLQIMNGPFQGLKYKFIRSITVGRDENDKIRILDPKASRGHIKIEEGKNGFRIIDQNSRNGTYVNGQKIKSRPLKKGDKIVLGSTELLYSVKKVFQCDQADQTVRISNIRKALDLDRDEYYEGCLRGTDIVNLGRRFQLLQKVNSTIGSEANINRAYEKILKEIFDIFQADRGAVLSLNHESGKVEVICTKTINGSTSDRVIPLSQTILDRVIKESVGLLIDDALSDDQFGSSDSIVKDDIRSVLCVPFVRDKQIIGIIYLDTLSHRKEFTEADLDLLISLAGPASIHLQNALYISQLKKSHWGTIQALAQAVDARDPYTIGHNRRVSRYAVAIGSYLHWPEEKIRLVELGGILHDIGKIGVSDTILLKPGPLNDEEMRSMRRHPEIGAKITAKVDFLHPVVPYVLYHHERWDGRGYPHGLKGPDIPEEGRLLAVCDTYDAMTTTRPYRKGLAPDIAIKELLKNRGKQFDPLFVNALVKARGWKRKAEPKQENMDFLRVDHLQGDVLVPLDNVDNAVYLT
jgi:HD-GYP domain-containing protein (c-di-GMP phosphodiesterase class II)/pSer/pThr/pTyr-binding forkhead associated (FHA) protein